MSSGTVKNKDHGLGFVEFEIKKPHALSDGEVERRRIRLQVEQLQKEKVKIIDHLVSDMFNDKEHYSYYSSIIIDFLRAYDIMFPMHVLNFKKKDIFVSRAKEHVEILREEFSDLVEIIDGII